MEFKVVLNTIVRWYFMAIFWFANLSDNMSTVIATIIYYSLFLLRQLPNRLIVETLCHIRWNKEFCQRIDRNLNNFANVKFWIHGNSRGTCIQWNHNWFIDWRCELKTLYCCEIQKTKWCLKSNNVEMFDKIVSGRFSKLWSNDIGINFDILLFTKCSNRFLIFQTWSNSLTIAQKTLKFRHIKAVI